MADLFISYAREDQQIAQSLAGRLEERGWSVWWDRDLVPGELFDEVIERELHAARGVIVIWSRVSVTSPWVRSEAGAAADRGVLIPVLTEPVEVPLRFRMLEAVDLSTWDDGDDDAGLRRLLAGVTALAGPPAPPGLRLPPPERTTAEVPVVAPRAAVEPPTPPMGQPPTPPSDSTVPVGLPPTATTAQGGGPAEPSSMTSSTIPVSTAVGRSGPSRSARRRRRLLPAVIVGLVAALVAAAMTFGAMNRGDDTTAGGTPPNPATVVGTSVAPSSTSSAPTSTVSDDTTTISPSTSPSTSKSIDDTNLLSEGDRGAAVRQIQQWLRDSGTVSGLDVDGEFGPRTTKAVMKFEEDNGLRVDGQLTVGADDWTLLRHLAETYQPGPTDTTPHPDGVVDPPVETGYGTISQCADGSYVTIVGSFESEGGAATASQGFEGSGVLPSSSCPSLTADRWLVVWGPFTSPEVGSSLCLELGLTSRQDCYVRPIDFSTDFRQWDPDGTFHDTPP